MLRVNCHPTGENLPNLVTLVSCCKINCNFAFMMQFTISWATIKRTLLPLFGAEKCLQSQKRVNVALWRSRIQRSVFLEANSSLGAGVPDGICICIPKILIFRFLMQKTFKCKSSSGKLIGQFLPSPLGTKFYHQGWNWPLGGNFFP
jgi:hypothetical protein